MSLLNDEDVVKIAETVFPGEKINVLKHEIARKSEETLGYLGDHFTLALTVLANEGRVERKFFLKTYRVEEEGENFIGKTGIFQKEVNIYKTLVEDLKKIASVPEWCPKYYYSKHRVLVLEDLSDKGFEVAHVGNVTLDERHLEAGLRTLSHMHASSVILEDEKSKTLISVYPESFVDIFYDENKPESPSRKWISWQIQDLLLGVDLLDGYSNSQKISIKEKFTKQIMRIFPLNKRSEKYRNVFTHGDVWKNNLLFRYAEGFPVECRLVDFQFARYAPPAHDVMHFLHYATKKALRDREEPRLLRFYYDNLKQNFMARGKDLENVLNWNEFVESCKEYKELALIQSLLSLHYILGPVNLDTQTKSYEEYETYLSNHRKEYMVKFFNTESYAEKIKEIMHELIDYYIMKE